jgi:hypothetical protein
VSTFLRENMRKPTQRQLQIIVGSFEQPLEIPNITQKY